MRKMNLDLRHSIIIISGLLCYATAAPAGTIPINIDEPTGKNRSEWAVRGGIPFPEGELRSTDNLRLLNPKGQAIPLQRSKLAVWPDGSLKWVLLNFDADLKSDKGAAYKLEYGRGVKGVTPEGGITVKETAAGVEVNTGAMKFSVPPPLSGDKLIDQVWLDLNGDRQFSADEAVLADGLSGFYKSTRSDNYEVGQALIEGPDDEARARIESVEVERSGPIEAVVLIKGHYGHAHFPESPFTVRLYARLGDSTIRVVHTFTYTGSPKIDFPSGIGLEIPLKADKAKTVMSFGSEAGMVGFRNGEDGFDHGATLQRSHLNYSIWRAAGEDHAPEELAKGSQSPGWADMSAGSFGLTVAMRNVWQEYPQEIHLDGRSGIVKACFWPIHGPVMDLRRYSDYMYRLLGEVTFARWSGSFQNEAKATGLAKTHECLLNFHPGPAEEKTAQAVSDAINQPSIIYVTPEWYRDTRALGYYSLIDKKRYPRLERTLGRYIDFFLASQDYWGWYSWLDYGDIGHMWGSTFWDGPDGKPDMRHEWDYDIGRWGWTNTEGMPGIWFHLHWLRTGERKYFLAAEAQARHTRDIDIFHWGHNKGRGHTRHNVNHWGDGDYEDRISGPISYSLHYYMTGDERSREVAEMVVDDHYLARGGPAATATLSAHLYGVLVRWEMTGDKKYEKIMRNAVDAFIDAQHPETGAYPNRAAVVVGTGERLGLDPMTSDGNGMFLHNFGLMQALIGYYNISKYDRLKDSLVRHADLCTRKLGGATSHFRLLAFAARVTGEDKYVRTIRERIKGRNLYGDRVNPDQADWTGTEAYMDPTGTYYICAIGHDMPYVMEVLGTEE
ncbi:hypothetical protein ACFLT7_05960 [candidate division KSB1 bacterium]